MNPVELLIYAAAFQICVCPPAEGLYFAAWKIVCEAESRQIFREWRDLRWEKA